LAGAIARSSPSTSPRAPELLLAAADADDAHHAVCSQLLREHRGQLKVPAPVVPETAWQVEHNLGPVSEARFLRLITSGQLEVVDLTIDDYGRCAELIEAYASLRLGLVDASVVTIAENLKISTLATLNHRDFRVVRPRHTAAFDLLPA
jgi:predicted nucleic acid-binding protein